MSESPYTEGWPKWRPLVDDRKSRDPLPGELGDFVVPLRYVERLREALEEIAALEYADSACGNYPSCVERAQAALELDCRHFAETGDQALRNDVVPLADAERMREALEIILADDTLYLGTRARDRLSAALNPERSE